MEVIRLILSSFSRGQNHKDFLQAEQICTGHLLTERCRPAPEKEGLNPLPAATRKKRCNNAFVKTRFVSADSAVNQSTDS
jgi:hypothetical protein